MACSALLAPESKNRIPNSLLEYSPFPLYLVSIAAAADNGMLHMYAVFVGVGSH